MDKKDIKTILKNRFEEYKYITYKETEKEWFDRMEENLNFILNSDYKFLDFYIGIRKGKITDNYILDFIQFTCKEISLRHGIPIDKIKLRYSDPYEEVEERMLFRIELYREGWGIEQIEKYIYKYMYRKEYDIPIEKIDEHFIRYNNVLKIQSEYKRNMEKRKGRPPLPSVLKEYIKKKHTFKLRDNMRNKYKASSNYEKIKENLLTKEEFQSIEKVINDKNILKKLKNLQLSPVAS